MLITTFSLLLQVFTGFIILSRYILTCPIGRHSKMNVIPVGTGRAFVESKLSHPFRRLNYAGHTRTILDQIVHLFVRMF